MRWLWIIPLCLSACSPYPFSKEVASFSTGVDQVSSGFDSGYSALAADRAASEQFTLLSRRSKALLASSCRVSVGKTPESRQPCVVFPAGSEPPVLTDVEQRRQQIMNVLTVLRNYAHGLAAVTNAADRSAYDAAVAQLSGAVGALAKTADPAAPGVATLAPAAVSLVGWVVGTALDQQRFDTLKAAVNAVSQPLPNYQESAIHVVVGTLKFGLENLDNARRDLLAQEAHEMVVTLGPTLSVATYGQRLTELQSVVSTLDGLRHADPSGTANALEKAHAALVKAVNDPAREYAPLLKAVGDFTDKAATLRAAFAARSQPPATAGKGS